MAGCTVFATPDGGPAEMCSPLYVAYNFGLMAFGVFLVLGIVLSRPAWPQSALAMAGLALYAVSGIGAVVTGAVQHFEFSPRGVVYAVSGDGSTTSLAGDIVLTVAREGWTNTVRINAMGRITID